MAFSFTSNGLKPSIGSAVKCCLVPLMVVFMAFINCCKAQVEAPTKMWENYYQGNESNVPNIVNGMGVDASGNVFVTGYTTNTSIGENMVTIKYDSMGTQDWAQTFAHTFSGNYYNVALGLDGAGNIYTGGNASGYTITKYNTSGTQQWAAGPFDFEGGVCTAMVVDNAGNTYVTGYTDDGGAGTAMYNSSGTMVWSDDYIQPYGVEDMLYCAGMAITLDNSGNIYVSGTVQDPNGDEFGSPTYDLLVLKYSSGGTLDWTYSSGSISYVAETPEVIAVNNNNGNVYIGLQSGGAIWEFSSAGAYQWMNYGEGGEILTGLLINPAGDLVVGGTSGTEAFVFEMNPNTPTSAYIWSNSYSGPAGDSTYGTNIVMDGNENVYLTSYSTDGAYSINTVKYNSSGQEQWAIVDSQTSSSKSTSLAVPGTGSDIYMAGTVKDEYYTVKYSVLKPDILVRDFSPNPVCAGATVSVNYKVQAYTPSGNFILELSDASGSFASPDTLLTFTGADSGSIAATIPADIPAGTGFNVRIVSATITGDAYGNAITVDTTPVLPTVTITANPTQTCAGLPVTFTATPTNGGNSPTYQWVKDGVNVNVGSNSPSYRDATLTNSDSVTCVLTSNATCATPATVTGNSVKVSIIQLVTPTIAISTSASGAICAGTNVTFTAATAYAGTAPQYQWEVNGYVVPCYSDTFNSSTLNNNDVVTCILTSNYSCVTDTTATSNRITMSVTGVNPTALISAAPGSTICAGTQVTLTATPGIGLVSPTYQWMLNNKSVGTGTTTYSYTPSNLDSVWVVITSNVGCATISQNSNLIYFQVNEPPSVALSSSNSGCVGNTVLTLTGASNAGQILWDLAGSPVSTTVPTAIDSGYIIAGGNGSGSAADQLTGPKGVWLDIYGNTYVADDGNNRIQKFPPNSISTSIAVTVAGGNGPGNQPDQVSPLDLFVNTNGDVYTSEAAWIQRFPAGSTSATDQIIVAGTGNAGGSGANQLTTAQSVKLDGSGNIYVSDVSNYRVQKFPANSTAGTNAVTVAGGNGSGSANDQFGDVIRIHVDQYDNLFVADNGNERIQKWAPGATSGITVAGGNGSGSGADQFNYPTGVFVDGMGNIYVTDNKNNRVQKFPPNSTSSTDAITVAGGNGSGSGYNQLGSALASYVDNNGNVYVAEYTNNRVTRWGQKIATNYTPASPGTFTAVVTSFAGCSATSNPVTVYQVVPTVSITASDTSIVAGTEVTFTATITNGGSNPVYQWKKNGTIVGTNSSTYSDNTLVNGDVISCTLTSDAACVSPATVVSGEIIIKIVITPVADFDAAPTIVSIGDTVTFTDLSTNNPTSWSWTLPGGTPSTSTLQNPLVVYNTAGTYNVSLTVTNIAGSNSLTKSIYITVINPAGCDTLSNIPKGAELVDYYAQFLGGYAGGPNSEENTAVAEGYLTPSGTVALTSVSFRFYKAKYANIKDSIIVSIWDTNEFGFPGNVIESQALTIADINTSGLTNVTFNVPLTIPDRIFYIGYSWNPGDTVVVYADTLVSDTIAGGAWGYGVGYGGWIPLSLIEPYEQPSPYTDFAIYPVFCTSGADAPVAAFTGVPTTVTQGDSVHFTDQSTNTPSAWFWVLTGASSTSSSVQNPTVAYNTVGTYDVTLTAANADGSGTLTKTSYITVVQPIPAACDTLANFYDTSTVTIYKDPVDGYISGNSEFGTDGTLGIAEPYTPPANGMLLEGVQFYFGYARYGNSGDGFNVYAWDATGPNGSPGNIIASQFLDFGSVNCLNTLTADPPATFVTFSTPPIIDGKFYVGFEPTYVPTDTIAVYTTVSGAFPNTGWVDIAPYGWQPYDSIFRYQLTNAILPILCTTTSLPVANFSGIPTALNAGGSVNFTDLSLNNPTVWSWSFPGGTPSASSLKDPTDIVYNTPGVYPVTLVATNAAGSNSVTKTGYITVNAIDPVANFSGSPTTLPIGGSVNFTDLSTNSPTGWSWSFPGGTPSSSTVENPTNIVYNSAGTYNVSLTSTNAGGSNSITKTSYITVTGKAPVAAFTASETKACEGSAITFTDQSTNSPTSWSWSFAGGTPSTSSSQDPTITYNTPGTYSVTLTATNNGGSNSSTRTNYITIGAPPSASASVTNVTCNGGDNGAITVTINGGTSPYTYHWNTQATTQNLSDVGQGTYALTITDNVGCTANTGGTVTQPQAIGVSVTTTAATCGQNNGTAVASTTGGIQPFTFAWSNNKSGPSITGLSGGSYTVTATDGNGCSKTAVATVNSTTAPNITLTPSATTCGNNNGSITTSVTGGSGSYTYSWSNGLSSANINGLASGSYSVTVNDGNCSATNSTTIGSSTPISLTTSTRSAACGESNGSATAIPSGGAGYTYYWNNGQTNDSATGISAGNYSVTVTAAGGCTASATASVSNVGGPGVTVSNITDVKCYGNNNGAVTITVSGGNGSYSYNWSNGTTQQNLTGLVANAYNVTVTSNGCISTASAYVTQPPQLNANAIAQDVSCNGGSNGAATAFVSGGVWPYSYNWSNSDVDSTVSGLSPGPYSLTVTDHNNCTDVVNTSVGQPAQLTILVSGTNPGCNTDNGLATATASGGIAPYTYVWSNNSTNSLLTGLAAGVYNVIGTDNNHCTVSGSVTLTAPVSMVLNPVSTPDCNNDNGTATVTITNGTWPYSFHWSNNQSDSVNTNLATGSVTVTVTDAVGCTATSSVNVGTGLALQDTTNNVSCYGGDNGSILLTVSGGSGNYSFSWSNENTTATLTGLASGSYSVTVSDKTNNCQGKGTYSVSQPAQLKDSVATTPTEQNGSTGTASTNTSGGVPPYSFHWSNGEGGSVITGLAAGNYSVTVTDKDSCQSSTDFTISNNSGISDPRDNIGLEIFPNPTDGLINIRLSSLDANTAVEIKVYDVLGNLLMDQSLPNKSRTLATQVSMNDFAAGIYLIQVSQPDWTLNRRIIIQH